MANKDNRPRLAARKRNSRAELDLTFNAFASLQGIDRGQQPPGICGRAEQVSRFLKRLIFGQRKHHHRLIAISCDDDRRVIFTDSIDRAGEILSRRGIGNGFHLDRILSNESKVQQRCFRLLITRIISRLRRQ